jgi:hypothetical protein
VVDAINELLDRIEQEIVQPDLPEDIMALPLLQMAYRGKVQLTPQQMRAAIEALPFEVPKLSAAAITSMDEKSFAAQLERCIERSKSLPMLNQPKTIEHEQLVSAAELKRPFPRNYRRF